MREIITQKKLNEIRPQTKGVDRSELTSQKPDEYLARLLKLIPAEVISLYIALAGIIASGGENVNADALLWIIFAVCLIGTPLYLYKFTKVSDHLQLLISTIAFGVWVFALGGPFATLMLYQPIYGALLLPIFVFGIPLIMPE